MMTTYCARQLMEQVDKTPESIKSSESWKMMTYVKTVTSQVRLRQKKMDQSVAIANLAAGLLIEWETARAERIRTVPYLSSRALKEHLGLVKGLLDTFDREWKHLEDMQLQLDVRLESAKIIIGKGPSENIDVHITWWSTLLKSSS
jgi:hypothetical protein